MESSVSEWRGYDPEEPFAIPDFTNLISFHERPHQDQHKLFDDEVKLDFNLSSDQTAAQDSRISNKTDPDVSLFQFTGAPEVDLPPLSELTLQPESLDNDKQQSPTELDHVPDDLTLASADSISEPRDDVWLLPATLKSLKNETKLLSWADFASVDKSIQQEPHYLSEAGPEAFDAALFIAARSAGDAADAGNAVPQDVLLRSLWQLVFGHESILFRFDVDGDSFVAQIDDLRASGISVECSQGLIVIFTRLGMNVRHLKQWTNGIRAGVNELPSKLALASAVDTILTCCEKYMMEQYPRIRSLLQLQILSERVSSMVRVIHLVVKSTKPLNKDVEVINKLLLDFALYDATDDEIRPLLLEISKRVAQPWIDGVACSVGLHTVDRHHLLSAEADNEADLSPLSNASRYPALLSQVDWEELSEARQCLHFIQQHQPKSELLQNRHPRGLDSALSLFFDWEDLRRANKTAEEYQQRMLAALSNVSHSLSRDTAPQATASEPIDQWFGVAGNHGLEANIEVQLESSIATFADIPSLDTVDTGCTLELETIQFLDYDASASSSTNKPTQHPSLASVVHLSLSPLLHIQHNLLSQVTISTIFQRGYLDHLRLHHAFSLFSSGALNTRLAAVLFSTDVESAERSKNHIRTGGSSGMGLRLGTGERSGWPPASSEVQLTLRGVLNDAWENDQDKPPDTGQSSDARRSKRNIQKQQQLPGNIAFAVRTGLSPGIIDRILDQTSIHALDFLHLSYEPPEVLAPLFTERVKDLYDRVFAFWLRMLRLKDALNKSLMLLRALASVSSTVDKELRLAQRLRANATAFFETMLSRIRIGGMEAPWRNFVIEVERLQRSLANIQHGIPNTTLKNMIRRHEAVLTIINSNCLLRKRQRKAAAALEELAQCVIDLTLALQQRVAGSSESLDVRAITRKYIDAQTRFLSSLEELAVKRERNGNERDAVNEIYESLQHMQARNIMM